MNSQLPIAVRSIAAALAVFVTVATLNGVISIAEPQQSQLIAASAARKAERMASTPQATQVALAPTGPISR